MKLAAHIIIDALVSALLLAAARVVWPGTAAELETGLQSFAVAVAGIVVVLLVTLAVSVVRSQMEPPYEEDRHA